MALVFAAAQSWGALLFVRPYVADFGGSWLFESMLTLVVGSVIMNHVSSPFTPYFNLSMISQWWRSFLKAKMFCKNHCFRQKRRILLCILAISMRHGPFVLRSQAENSTFWTTPLLETLAPSQAFSSVITQPFGRLRKCLRYRADSFPAHRLEAG